MRHGNRIRRILELLGKGVRSTAQLIDAAVPGYEESYRRARRRMHGLRDSHLSFDASDLRADAQRFYTLMNKLKREGFVAREKRGASTFWRITREGRAKEKMLRKREEWRAPRYAGEDDGVLRIVAFDVPERERGKRVWLQAALKSLGFTLLQKSVWMGTVRAPRAFLEDLRAKRMLGYVHIFEAGKKGTLEEREAA